MPLIKFIFLAFIVLSTACTRSTLTTQVNVDISPEAQLLLELPSKELWGTELNQQMEIRYADQIHQLVLLTAFNADGIAIVAITPAGIPLFELSFSSNKEIKITKHIPVEGLAPEHVLADLQLVYWSIEQLKQQLSAGVTVIDNGKGVRSIFQGSKPIIQIKQNKNNITYEHLIRHYQFTVTNLG